MDNALVWRPRITVSDTTQRRLWENLRDLRDVSEETSLINLQGDVSEICKSALFEMSLRRCMRRLRDASEMHSCPQGIFLLQHRFFPIKFANFLRTPFFAENIRWLLLKIMNSSSHLRVLPICYKIVSPILLKELINDFTVCKCCSEKVLLVENVTNSHGFGN